MEREKVEGSSNVSELGYDKETKTLQVRFKNGSIYDYQPVTLLYFLNLKNAESKGKFLNENIIHDKNIACKRVG